MNERMIELAKQAGYTPDMFGVGHWDMPECKKFAELIVEECIVQIQLTTARDPQTSAQYRQSVGHIHRIRRHFGLTE